MGRNPFDCLTVGDAACMIRRGWVAECELSVYPIESELSAPVDPAEAAGGAVREYYTCVL